MPPAPKKFLGDYPEFQAKPWYTAEDARIPCEDLGDPARLSPAPLVSVVMITYNHERCIRQAVAGVLQQKTDFAFELILGEDCSTDQTRRLVQECQQAHPEKIRSVSAASNVGGPDNATRAMALARGRFIAFCEGDDEWLATDKLQRQVDFLRTHPEHVLVYTGARCRNEATGVTRDLPRRALDGAEIPQAELPRRLLRFDIYLPTASVLFRADPDILAGIQKGLQDGGANFVMGDFPLFMEVARFGRFMYFPEQMVLIRVLAESASRSSDPARLLRYYASELACFRYYMDRVGMKGADRADVLERLGALDLRVAYAMRHRPLAELAYQALHEAGRIRLPHRLWYLGATSALAFWLLVRPANALHLAYWRCLRRRRGPEQERAA
jgi:glycosyltransferase involved in cell wall biosynthesis